MSGLQLYSNPAYLTSGDGKKQYFLESKDLDQLDCKRPGGCESTHNLHRFCGCTLAVLYDCSSAPSNLSSTQR